MRDQVIPNLFVSSEQDAVDFWFGQQPHVSIDLTGWNIDLELNNENLETVIKVAPIIHKCLGSKIPCLVYCHGGIDRSPFMVACYLLKFQGYMKWDAYQTVKNMHPETIIHDDWMRAYADFLKDGESKGRTKTIICAEEEKK